MEERIVAILQQASERLALHAGGVSFVRFDEATGDLHVRFEGMCRSCPLAAFTLQHSVSALVCAEIPEVRNVLLVQ